MTIEEVEQVFEKHEDEYLKFDRVVNPKSKSSNLHGVMLLDSILPFGTGNFLSGAAHDEVWLEVDIEELSGKLTEDLVIELLRSGIRLDSSFNSLRMYV